MRRFLKFLAVATICTSSAALAQKSTQEIPLEMESSNRAAKIEMERSRLMWQQMEPETERLRLASDRLWLWNESQDISNRAIEIAELAEQAEAAKKAEEAVDELREEMEQAAVRTKNYIYLGAFTLFVAGFSWQVVRRSKIEEPMKDNKKFGIATVVCSILLMLLTIMASEDWVYRFDFLQNLMTSLRIKLFAENNCTGLYCSYVIDFPSKYGVLACLCGAAYGLTTYLGITPLPQMLRKRSDNENQA